MMMILQSPREKVNWISEQLKVMFLQGCTRFPYFWLLFFHQVLPSNSLHYNKEPNDTYSGSIQPPPQNLPHFSTFLWQISVNSSIVSSKLKVTNHQYYTMNNYYPNSMNLLVLLKQQTHWCVCEHTRHLQPKKKPLLYIVHSSTYLLTYLLHGAESFLRS